MSDLLRVVVKRSEWFRGLGGIQSRLLVPDLDSFVDPGVQEAVRAGKNKCCLGFACLAKGVAETELVDVAYPYMISRSLFPALSDGAGLSDLGFTIADTNDTVGMPDTEREAALIISGKEAGITFEFVD